MRAELRVALWAVGRGVGGLAGEVGGEVGGRGFQAVAALGAGLAAQFRDVSVDLVVGEVGLGCGGG